MLRVIVEIVPHGEEARKREIGKMIIGLHDHPKYPEFGNYTVEVMEYKLDRGQIGMFTTDQFHITDHRRDAGAFELIKRAFEALCHPETR